MRNTKVSLIITLKNEESSIEEFLDSLLSQSRPPDEILIVDGGSTDNTVEIINSYIESGMPINLIIKEGVNIAQGRNIAIKNAKYDTIASTDVGCRLDKNWLKELIKHFDKDPTVDVVSGFYLPDAKTTFEECVGELIYPKIEKIDPDRFLPSSRSIAFKKIVWKNVGGYPEWLYTAEDTLFDFNLRRTGQKFVFAPEAVVYWRPRSSLRDLFRQYYLYAKGDVQANILGIEKGKYSSIGIQFFVIVLFIISFYLNNLYPMAILISIVLYYFLRYGLSLLIRLKKASCLYYGPAIALTTLVSSFIGIFVAEIRKITFLKRKAISHLW